MADKTKNTPSNNTKRNKIDLSYVLVIELIFTAFLVAFLNPFAYSYTILSKAYQQKVEGLTAPSQTLPTANPSDTTSQTEAQKAASEVTEKAELNFKTIFLGVLFILGILLFFFRGLGSQTANWITIRLDEDELEMLEDSRAFLAKRGLKSKKKWIPFQYKLWFLWGKRGEFPLNKLLMFGGLFQILFFLFAIVVPTMGKNMQMKLEQITKFNRKWLSVLMNFLIKIVKPPIEKIYSIKKNLLFEEKLGSSYQTLSNLIAGILVILALLVVYYATKNLIELLAKELASRSETRRTLETLKKTVKAASKVVFILTVLILSLVIFIEVTTYLSKHPILSMFFYYLTAHFFVAFANNLRVAKLKELNRPLFGWLTIDKLVNMVWGVSLATFIIEAFLLNEHSIFSGVFLVFLIIPLVVLLGTVIFWGKTPLSPLVDERREARLFSWLGYAFDYLEKLKRGVLGYLIAIRAVSAFALWVMLFYFDFWIAQLLMLYATYLLSYRLFVSMWKDFCDLMGGGRIFYFAARGLLASVGLVGVFALMAFVWPSILQSNTIKMFISVLWMALQGFFASGVDIGSTGTVMAPQPDRYEFEEGLAGMDKWFDFKMGIGLCFPKSEWRNEILPESITIAAASAVTLAALHFQTRLFELFGKVMHFLHKQLPKSSDKEIISWFRNKIEVLINMESVEGIKVYIFGALVALISLFLLRESAFWFKNRPFSFHFIKIFLATEFPSRRVRATPPAAFMLLRFSSGHTPFFGYDLTSNAVAWRFFE